MGSALAATGALFPLIAPGIGWIGVFLTGSVVNNDTLFAPLQVATAEGIGSDPALFVGANTAGGNAAKVISPQSIAIAAGPVGLSGRRSAAREAASRAIFTAMRWPRTSTIARKGGRCRTGEAESFLSPAHTLAVPNEHAVSIHDASAEALQAVLLLAQEAARATETSLGARGVNALNASGPGSDQSAPHLHL